jgi:hypothetical protein
MAQTGTGKKKRLSSFRLREKPEISLSRWQAAWYILLENKRNEGMLEIECVSCKQKI